MINYVLSRHAKERLQDRGIPIKLVEETLNNPTRMLADGINKHLYQKLYRKGNKLRLLMIVVTMDESGKFRVITVIETSKVRKYFK